MLCASEKSTYYKNSFNIAVVAPFFETVLMEHSLDNLNALSKENNQAWLAFLESSFLFEYFHYIRHETLGIMYF